MMRNLKAALLTISYIALFSLLSVSPARAQTPVTVSWSVWGSPEELASHQRVADAFMRKHLAIRVEIRHIVWENYHAQIKQWMASGDPKLIPDIIWLGEDFERYHTSGYLENLSPWIEKTGYNVDDYWSNLIARASFPDGVYGLQRDLDLRLMYFNKDIFTAAGVAYPNERWTWDDWANAARKLIVTENGTITRFGLAMEMEKFDMLLLQNGGALFDNFRNPSVCTLNSEKSLQAVQFFAGMLNERVAMRDADLKANGGDAEAFLKGKAAMIIQNGSRAPGFNSAGLNYDVATIPLPVGGRRVNNNDGARFVMSSRSLQKEQAWTFLSWLQSRDGGQTLYTEAGEIFPALKSVAQSDSFQRIKVKPANRTAYSLEATGGQYLVLGDFSDWGDVNDNIVKPGLAKIWNGEGRPDEIVRSMCDQVDEFLRTNGYPKPAPSAALVNP
jgi:multiple sugar transport system substrate-binding protein